MGKSNRMINTNLWPIQTAIWGKHILSFKILLLILTGQIERQGWIVNVCLVFKAFDSEKLKIKHLGTLFKAVKLAYAPDLS